MVGENDDYKYFMETALDKYVGEWVAIHNKAVIAHGKDLERVFEKAAAVVGKSGSPFIAKVPEEATMIF